MTDEVVLMEEIEAALRERAKFALTTLRQVGVKSPSPWPWPEGREAGEYLFDLAKCARLAVEASSGLLAGKRRALANRAASDLFAIWAMFYRLSRWPKSPEDIAEFVLLGARLGRQDWHQDIFTLGGVQSPRHRPRGSGLAAADAPYVDEIRARWAAGEPKDAVVADVAQRAPGAGVPESKARRLWLRLSEF